MTSIPFAKRHPVCEIQCERYVATLDIPSDLWIYLTTEANRRGITLDVLFASVVRDYAASRRRSSIRATKKVDQPVKSPTQDLLICDPK